jgi:hypothetical protein
MSKGYPYPSNYSLNLKNVTMRKFLITATLACGFFTLLLVACKKEAKQEQRETVSQEVLNKIKNLGFSTEQVVARDGGYIVEGDIFLGPENLDDVSASPTLRIAEVEQYRTYNLVTRLPRTITISVSGLGSAYVQGTDLAIARYNAENLQIRFQRVSSGGDIRIEGFYEGPSGGFITLGSAGFPTSNGNPYNRIRMNTHPQAYGANPNVNYVGSVIQHEIGHCIGFRHTDYMNRAFSCGVGGNEGGTVSPGAIRIPGTPSGPDSGSWMLACSNGGNRTFNANDRIALNYLY